MPDDQPPSNGRLSPILPGRSGRPSFSLDALREQIEKQFHDETTNRPDILRELDTSDKRRALLTEIADYVLALDAITLSRNEKNVLLDHAYRYLFGFGPLDELIARADITEITVNGPFSVHIRRGAGKLEPAVERFDDHAQLVGTLERILASSGFTLSETQPFIEAGLVLAGRPARVSLIGPPVSPDYHVEIRLHPRQPLTLDDLYTRFHAVPPQAAVLLKAILAAGHGLLIVGEVGLGKTTLAGALANSLPTTSKVIAVERAAEMALPPFIMRRAPAPPEPDHPGSDFAAELQSALDNTPDWLMIDEIRGDESAAVWDALTRPNAPHYLWVFRGDSQAARLRSAISMVIRKEVHAVDQQAINQAVLQHLPFVAALKRMGDTPRLSYLAEWAQDESDPAGSLVLRPILAEQDEGWLVIENRPLHPVELPDEFWA